MCCMCVRAQAKEMRLKPHTSQVINYMQHSWQQRQQTQQQKSMAKTKTKRRRRETSAKEKQKNGNTSFICLFNGLQESGAGAACIVARKRYLSISVDNYDEHNKRNLWIDLHNQSRNNFVGCLFRYTYAHRHKQRNTAQYSIVPKEELWRIPWFCLNTSFEYRRLRCGQRHDTKKASRRKRTLN